jgi:hypothetical protein
MGAERIYRRLQDLRDVDPNGLPDQAVPKYETSVSSFVVNTVAGGGGGGGSFSLGASTLGNTLGLTGVTGSRLVLAGIGAITLSQSLDGNGGTISISAPAGGGAGFSAGVSGGNTAGDTGATGTRVVFAGGNNITLSQSTNANGGTVTISGPSTSVQTVQTQNLHNISLTGNTAGGMAEVSSGTLTLAGGNGITLSQAGNAVTISGETFSQSVQPETQTFLGGVSASDTLYTSGTVRFTGVGGGVTVSSNTGQRVDISVAAPVAQTLQTQDRFNLTLSGNTAGALAQISSGTMTLAGGNNITLSQNGNAVTISGPNVGGAQTGISSIVASDATYTSGQVEFTGSGIVTIRSSAGQRVVVDASQSVQPETQTFVGGLANSQTTYTSGTVSLGELGAITIRSTTGNQFQLSVNPQSVQPETQTFIGGISASDTLYTSGSVRFTGVGGGVTVSSNTGQRVDISVAAPVAQTGTQFSGGLSNIGNTAGDTGTVAGRLVLAGGNGVTLSGSTNGASETITISGITQSVQTQGQMSLGVSTGGNTAGDTGVTGTRMVFVGSNNITLSQATAAAGGTITISGPTTAAQTNQTLGMYALGNTTGQSSSTTFDARTVSIRGDGIVSVGYSGGTLRISATQSVQPETQTAVSGIANSQTTYTSGTVSLSELGAITIRSTTGNQFQFSVNSQTVQTQNLHNVTLSGNTAGALAAISSGTLTLAGGNNITLSQAGNAVTISGAADVAFSGGVSNVGNTAGDTGITGTRLVLAGGNGITLSQSTNVSGGTVTVSGITQSVESQSIGMSNIGNTSGTTGIASGGQVRFLFAGGNNITLSQSLNGASGTITISAPNTAAQTNQTLGMYAVQNTTGQSSSTTMDARTLSVAGDGAVSVGYSGGSLRISAPVQTAQTGISSIVASDATYTSGSVQFTGSGIVTVRSSANQRVVIDASQSVQTQNLHNVTLSGNTSGALAAISSGTLTLAGGANITLSQAGNAVTISGAGGITSDTDVTSITQTAHGLAVGDWVRLNSTNYVKAQANNETNAEVVGVVSAVADANTFTLTTGGLVTGLSGLTAGAVYYLSASTAGAITATEPTGNGEISKPVFIARTTTSGYVFNMRGNIINTTPLTAFLAGMSNVGNTSGDTGITGSRLVLAGGNNITLSQSTNASGGTVTISAFTQTVQTQNLHNVTLSGNTAGALAAISSGTLTLAGGNNITLSQAGNAVTISGGAGGGFSAGMSNIGNTSGDTGITGSRLVLAGGNNITLSQSTNASGGTVTISAPTQTDQTVGMYAVGNTTGQSSSTTRDARSISVDGAGAVSVGYSAGTLRISAPVQTAQTAISGIANSQTTYTSGTVSLSELGAVTIRSTTGNQFQISVNSQTAQTGISGIANSQTTYTSGTVSMSELGAITIRSTTGNQYQFSVNAQTGTQFSAGLSNIGNTAGDTVTNGGRLILAGGNGITLSGSSNGVSQTITISGITQSVESQSIGMSNVGNTSGTTGMASAGQVRFVFAGGNNITLSQSLNGASGTITISAPNLGAGAMSAGVSTGGNTAGATGITGTQLVLVGGNALSLSQTTGANGGTVTFNAAGFSAGVSTGGNTAGDTGMTATRLVLVGSSPVSLSQATGANGATVTINAPATSSLVGVSGISISTAGSTISIMQTTGSGNMTSFAPYDESPHVTGQQGQGTLHLSPLRLPADLAFDRIGMGFQISNATNSSGSFTMSNWVALYTKNVSTLSLLASTSISTNFTGSGTAGSYASYGGPRWHTIGWTTTLTGGDYVIGFISRTTSGGADHSISQLLISKFTNSAWSGLIGANSGSTAQHNLGQGHYSATTSSVPATIPFTAIVGSGSIVLRNPVYIFRSGTV